MPARVFGAAASSPVAPLRAASGASAASAGGTLAEPVQRRLRMLRTAMGPEIAAALDDPDVVEVLLNPDGTLWVDRLASVLDAFTALTALVPLAARTGATGDEAAAPNTLAGILAGPPVGTPVGAPGRGAPMSRCRAMVLPLTIVGGLRRPGPRSGRCRCIRHLRHTGRIHRILGIGCGARREARPFHAAARAAGRAGRTLQFLAQLARQAAPALQLATQLVHELGIARPPLLARGVLLFLGHRQR